MVSTYESFSIATAKLPLPPGALRLYRMGSDGSSVVIDSVENNVETESSSTRKLPSSKYKGVVPQPNGRWGAQIYEKHLRVWLGTFNEEEEAACSYDIAARKFRGRDAVVNFKILLEVEGEFNFHEAHSKAEIVDMLRKHTYDEELSQTNKKRRLNTNSNAAQQNDVVLKTRELLFEKTVTPSDVGKLNRLVIRKHHAEKHFQSPSTTSPLVKGVLMNFEDVTTGKMWRFRYSYWNSSQSYVLTKGWSRFVKEKNLRAGDVVTFEKSNGPDQQLYIDVKTRSGLMIKRPVRVLVRLFGVDIFNVPKEVSNDMFGSMKQAIINAL
ncbi:unnamed protein product [Cochlearia groenlandica]